ncbi:efflux RND transporter periplasmic adaptor subunit [Neorhodopirellula lusitana]|uniref:efflux RND transporter periplasmic adaptor subunit n=1 Tax=Neorhodopirellula lusitana TaxID=445327 RepID=UPI003850D983
MTQNHQSSETPPLSEDEQGAGITPVPAPATASAADKTANDNTANDNTANEKAADETAPGRSTFRIVANVIVSVAVLGLSIFGYTFLGERPRPNRSKPAKSPVMIVTTDPLVLHDGPVEIDVNGVVVPLREIRLATEVPGRVVKISDNVRAGRNVSQGEALIELDATEYDLEVKRLQALSRQEAAEVKTVEVSIENTKQLVDLALRQLDIARQESRRVTSLVSQRAASVSEVDTAKRAELNSEAALVGLENQQRELAAQKMLVTEKRALTEVLLQRARLDLSRCVVRSPIDGRVVTSTVEEQSFVPTGTTFITIEDVSAVEVRASLTADQMFWIWSSRVAQTNRLDKDKNTPDKTTLADTTLAKTTLADDQIPAVPATITFELGNEIHRWSAVLERIDGAGIDLNTRTYPCLFRVNAPKSTPTGQGARRLTRGMFVGVSIQAEPNRPLFRVPETAIRPGNRLWLNVDGKLRIVPITIVSRINAGLTQGLEKELVVEMLQQPDAIGSLSETTVIVSPISDPADGMPVGTQADIPPQARKLAKQVVETPDQPALPSHQSKVVSSSAKLPPVTEPEAKVAG